MTRVRDTARVLFCMFFPVQVRPKTPCALVSLLVKYFNVLENRFNGLRRKCDAFKTGNLGVR